MIVELKNILNQTIRQCNEPGYNYSFNPKTGLFARWGNTKDDNPEFSPIGPEIIDMEISTVCHNKSCGGICYKNNSVVGKNMSFETFKQIFDKLPENVMQIAFGIGSLSYENELVNPDLFKIMEYCRMNGVVPNITINGSGMTSEYYDELAILCGAVAVSVYDYDTCYNAVKELTDRGMTQINIHALLSEQSYDKCMKVMLDRHTDTRLAKLNAIVFLWLKPKGKKNTFTQLTSLEKYKKLIDYALDNNIAIGMDSCSASNFLKVIKDNPNYDSINKFVEPCESGCFSIYCNINGEFFPCSFAEGIDGITGVDILSQDNFLKDVWFGPEISNFRKRLLSNKDCNECRMCPIFNLEI